MGDVKRNEKRKEDEEKTQVRRWSVVVMAERVDLPL